MHYMQTDMTIHAPPAPYRLTATNGPAKES